MELTLQQILDGLSERLSRPAVLEDRYLRLIAYSSHDQPLDGVREDSILRRHASPEVTTWLRHFGVPNARRPLRLPANPDLQMLPRVCVPVIHKEKVLGLLWFVDPDHSMTAADIDFCVREAIELGELLHRESVANLFSSARLADTLHMLLNDSSIAGEAARSLQDAGYITAGDGVIAVVIQGLPASGSGSVDIEDELTHAMAEFRRLGRRGQALDLVRRDHCVLLLSGQGDDDPRLDERVAQATELAEAALAASGSASSVVVGVGSQQSHLEHAAESFNQARMSADAARLLPGVGTVVHWSRLGVHQIVVRLASLGEQLPTVHTGLAKLLHDPDALPLLETLETYLDVAGNAQLTAERLNLHRTSLYYRLQRLEQLAHTDLKNGVERLALHLALKVARMTGEYAPHQRRGAARASLHQPTAPQQSRVALTR